MEHTSSADRPVTVDHVPYLPVQGGVARRAIGEHRALHNQGELTVLMTLLDALQPVRIIETGTWAGGSAWAFSQLYSVRHIVSIDPAPQPGAAQHLETLNCHVDLLQLDSTQASTRAAVEDLLDGLMADVVFIDGDHLYESARADFDNYMPFVRPGGLVVVHDTQGYPGNDTVQVPKLWAEVRLVHRTTELIDKLGGPGGTGLVWL